MDAKYSFPDNCCNGHGIKAIAETLPDSDTGPPFAFVVKAIDFVEFRAFVVAPNHKNKLWAFNFVSEQQADAFEGLLAPVDIIPQK